MATERDRRREAYVGKARAELSSLAARGVRMGGNAFSAVVLAKGELSPEERNGAELLSGSDGVALRKSLSRLGYEPEDWCTLFLPAPGSAGALDASVVRETLAALDPATLVCCDDAAAQAVRDAFADNLASLAGSPRSGAWRFCGSSGRSAPEAGHVGMAQADTSSWRALLVFS